MHVTHPAGQAFDTVTATLAAHGPVVLPALLLCDFGHLAHEVGRLEKAGAAALHLDVMDGRFVPQLTYGAVVVEAVRRAARVPIEVHLMVEEPERSLADWAKLGVDIVTVHVEGLADPRAALHTITSLGARAHLAISPGTPVDRIEPFLDACDGVLVMSVEPGFGGQRFEPVALEKLRHLAALRGRRSGSFLLGVDGGISADTVGPAAAAGAELIVAGSAVIRSSDYSRAISELESLARSAA
ncbi:MAG: ribulose-phosphate 3-epimerase [Planctomycetota bacterium]|jgi:ribulose-phosphate 3-epimerase|nr:MAG: ribulose-phosphate 3-epimerase [Planctomycetota bacterium]